jgi:phosphatidylserine/phosphatidylglycerophosphate/cardiolipin synthase-like enzyme
LLFIAIETAPIFVKLISYRSPYDYILHQQEHVFEMANKEQVSLLSNLTNNRIAYDTETGKYLVHARIAAHKELIDYKLKEKLEELKKRPFDWKLDQKIIIE